MVRPADEVEAEVRVRFGALSLKQVWVLLLRSLWLLFALSVQLVDYCRTLDAARLAGDSSGHTFDAAVIRRLMAAPDPVQDVILEHLGHVIEKYRAPRCAFEDHAICSVGDNASALLQHTISNLETALKQNPMFRGKQLVRYAFCLILNCALSWSMLRSLFGSVVRQRKRRRRHGVVVIGRRLRRLLRLGSRRRLKYVMHRFVDLSSKWCLL